MEEMMMSKKQTWGTSSNALAVHRDSQTISKPKPKIRIIHIFAPEIIKTNVANFRELVQRLTGKPSDNGCSNKKKRAQGVSRRASEAHHQRSAFMAEAKKMELLRSKSSNGGGSGFRGFEQLQRSERVIKEEEVMWNAEKSGGFLERFAELEGFIQELGEYPMLPNLESASAAPNSHLLHGFEGTQLV